MLLDLEIRDFAIIDDLQIQFGHGLNALTGETGAGKSIIIDALGAVLGERVSADMVRSGAKTAYVDARFQLDGFGGIASAAGRAERPWDRRAGWRADSESRDSGWWPKQRAHQWPNRHSGTSGNARAIPGRYSRAKRPSLAPASHGAIGDTRSICTPRAGSRGDCDVGSRLAKRKEPSSTHSTAARGIVRNGSICCGTRSTRSPRLDCNPVRTAELEVERSRLANAERLGQLVASTARLDRRRRARRIVGGRRVAQPRRALGDRRARSSISHWISLSERMTEAALLFEEIALELRDYLEADRGEPGAAGKRSGASGGDQSS